MPNSTIGKSSWTEAVLAAVKRYTHRHATKEITRQGLIKEELNNILIETGSISDKPEYTLSRELQELRDMGILRFDERGGYTLLKDLIDGNNVDLTSNEVIITSRRKGQKTKRKLTHYWWTNIPEEKYWVEITDRDDIGADLKCPKTDDAGNDYWSYSLIKSVWPGDIVFHYSTKSQSFVGASVAGGPLEERSITWAPHGTVGRSKSEHNERPGWWLPLYGFTVAKTPFTLAQARDADNQSWIRNWVENKREFYETVAAPFQMYRPNLRGAQGYLTKMPLDFINKWSEFSDLVESLSDKEDELIQLSEIYPAESTKAKTDGFKPRSADEYVALIQGGTQRRSRNHEKLVNNAAEYLKARGAMVSNPHPFDLFMIHPHEIIIEAKLVGKYGAGLAIREAVGQLFEYQYFIGPKSASLCILLDGEPDSKFVIYVEEKLNLLILWAIEDKLNGGPKTLKMLENFGIIIVDS